MQPIKDQFRLQHSRVIFIIKIIDTIIVSAPIYILISIFFKSVQLIMVVLPVLLTILFFWYFSEISRLYISWRSTSLKDELLRITRVWIFTFAGTLLVTFFLKLFPEFRRLLVISWFVIPLILILIWRIILRAILRELRKFGWNLRNIAVIGAGDLGIRLARKIAYSPWMGIRILGFFDDSKEMNSIPDIKLQLKIIGTPDDLIELAENREVDQVYIALPLKAEKRIKDLITKFSKTTVSVYWIPDYFTFDILHSHWLDFDGIPAVSIFESPFYGIDSWVKRAEDLILGMLITIVILLPMIIIGLGIKINSKGPIIFKQKRYGLNGEKIFVWKFRTMTVTEDGEENFKQATRNDARITTFGKFLRRTSLDELPQFINVLQGRMSIVGPRPHPVAMDDHYKEEIYSYMLRHKVKPGITGWAQVNGWRGETDTTDKIKNRVECDINYIKNWSLTLDLKIIFMTMFIGFTGRNAY